MRGAAIPSAQAFASPEVQVGPLQLLFLGLVRTVARALDASYRLTLSTTVQVGAALGVFFAALTTAALADLGLTFALPLGQLGVFLLLAVVVGVLGAVAPARRAARTDVLDAMSHE